jgi:hypothetical protein
MSRKRPPVFSLLALLAGAVAARGAEAEVEALPDVSLRTEMARYAPASVDQALVGSIGARSGLVRWRDTTFFLSARIETILGTERRETDANQGSYHIELGVDQRLRALRLTPFFHHVSRHALDRSKPDAVDWNVIGVRIDGPWPSEARPRLWAGFGVGHTTLASLIGYRWELTGQLDATVFSRASAAIHCRGRGRVVTTEPSDLFPRDAFLDWSVEVAARWTHSLRVIEPFVTWEHRNDVLLTQPGSRTRLLLGLRFGIEDGPRRRPAPERTPDTSVPDPDPAAR